MSWLLFAFSGPLLWAISTHLDKYLVEQYFKHCDVAVLLVFTAFIGVLTLPLIAFLQPKIAGPGPGSIALIVLSGILYMGAALRSEPTTSLLRRKCRKEKGAKCNDR